MPALADAVLHDLGISPACNMKESIETSKACSFNSQRLSMSGPCTPTPTQGRRVQHSPFIDTPMEELERLEPLPDGDLDLNDIDPMLLDLPDVSEGLDVPSLDDLLCDYTATFADAEKVLQILRQRIQDRVDTEKMTESLISSASKPEDDRGSEEVSNYYRKK